MNQVFKKQILPNPEQMCRADPFWRVIVTSEPQPDLLLSRRCWGSVV